MEKTLDDLKKCPDTLIKFFLLHGKAELSMFNDAYAFYLTASHSNWKPQRKNKKRFTKYFLRSMKFFNSVKK
jgi:hypothetical protein